MESGKVAITSEDSNVPADKKLRSPSHSSSSSDEVVQLGSPGTSASNAGVGEEIPVSSTPNGGQSSDGSATRIPPSQATDQGSLSETSDRIPAYVFSRTNTASPMEWSVASNESLFSIHMGNMSFSREQLSWMSKSGELGYFSDSTLSGPMADIPSNTQAPTKTSSEIMKNGDLNEDRYDVNEAAAAETMREVLRQNEAQNKDNIVKESPHSRSLSQHSDASVKSFAFPILTGDHADKSGSLRKSTRNKNQMSRPSTPKATPQSPSDIAKTQTPPETPKPQSPPETPKPETAKSQTSKATRNAETRRWFSCFSCCPSCF